MKHSEERARTRDLDCATHKKGWSCSAVGGGPPSAKRNHTPGGQPHLCTFTCTAPHRTARRNSFLPCCSPARTARARTGQHETQHLRCSRFVFKWFPRSHSAALLPLLPGSLARRVAFVASSALTVTTRSSSQLMGRSGATRRAC